MPITKIFFMDSKTRKLFVFFSGGETYFHCMELLLKTDRLYMRHFTLADSAMLADMHSDPEVTRYTGDVLPWDTIEQAERVLTEIIMPQYPNKIGRWAVHVSDTDEFIGWCGLKDTGGEVDLGYRYYQKHWGRGYATEAAKAVLQYGIDMRLQNIVGRASVHNLASIRVLEKIGLTFKEYYMDNGRESVKYGLEMVNG
jgi:RimJ/RimL family protein N-acetyltransferase